MSWQNGYILCDQCEIRIQGLLGEKLRISRQQEQGPVWFFFFPQDFFFKCAPFLKFIEFVTILLLFYVFVFWP